MGQTGEVVSVAGYRPRGPWFETWPGRCCCGLEQVTFTPCLVLVKPRKLWTYDWLGQTLTSQAGDYVVPSVLSLRDLVSRPDNMDKTALHTTEIGLSSLGGQVLIGPGLGKKLFW